MGVKQESLWWWHEIREESKSAKFMVDRYDKRPIALLGVSTELYKEPIYSAFTVSECLAIYGEEITIPKGLTSVADFIAKKIVDKLSKNGGIYDSTFISI